MNMEKKKDDNFKSQSPNGINSKNYQTTWNFSKTDKLLKSHEFKFSPIARNNTLKKLSTMDRKVN